ncbi:unnamed protein product [Paramecium octaurelia]|uniref:Uncharacterized protein n=1 Tax=Paramecium octaurelia TaxID=43137 RepID=A0A8S1VMS7_PAROT|nr:unnamed protein product [Paramecium octaurelia]
MGMHILIARLDMIVLLTQPEPLTEIQQFEIQKYLRLNKSLFSENQINSLMQLIQNKNYEHIRNLYLRRYTRLEELLSLDLSIEQIYDYCIRVYLKEIKKLGNSTLKTYNNIIETHRIQQAYFLREPQIQQQHYNCLDLEQDETNKYLLLSSLYNRNRFEEPRFIYMSDLLRRRMQQMIKDISDRNQTIQKSINQYYHQNKKKSYCLTPKPVRSRNNTFYKNNAKVTGLRVQTEFVIEKRLPARSIYQIKKIQLLDENENNTPNNKNSCKALGRPRSLIRTKFQQLIN